MADFSARPGEIVESVAIFVRRSRSEVEPINATAGTMAPTDVTEFEAKRGEERTSFLDNTADYFQARQRVLNELIEAMNRATSGDEDSDETWRRKAEELKSATIATLGKLLAGIDEPDYDAIQLRWSLQSDEARFNDGLLALQATGAAWQNTALLLRDTNTMFLNCGKEWLLLVRKAEEIHAGAASAVTTMVSNLAASPGLAESQLGDLTTAVAEVARLAGEASSDVKLADLRGRLDSAIAAYNRTFDAIQRVEDGWRATADNLYVDIRTLRRLQEPEFYGLHPIFKEKRQTAQGFVGFPPTSAAQAIREQLIAAFGGFASRIDATNGMRRDAELLFEQLNAQIVALNARLLEALEAFEREYEGRFLGTLSDDTVEQLTQADGWAALRNRVRERHDADTLKTLVTRLRDPALRLEPALDTLARAVNARSAEANEDDRRALLSVIDGARNQARTMDVNLARLGRVCEGLTTILEGAEMSLILDRGEIVRSLRS